MNEAATIAVGMGGRLSFLAGFLFLAELNICDDLIVLIFDRGAGQHIQCIFSHPRRHASCDLCLLLQRA